MDPTTRDELIAQIRPLLGGALGDTPQDYEAVPNALVRLMDRWVTMADAARLIPGRTEVARAWEIAAGTIGALAYDMDAVITRRLDAQAAADEEAARLDAALSRRVSRFLGGPQPLPEIVACPHCGRSVHRDALPSHLRDTGDATVRPLDACEVLYANRRWGQQ